MNHKVGLTFRTLVTFCTGAFVLQFVVGCASTRRHANITRSASVNEAVESRFSETGGQKLQLVAHHASETDQRTPARSNISPLPPPISTADPGDVAQSAVDGLAADACQNANSLRLENVILSVTTSYPLLEVALGELAAAEGKALASWGSLDTIVSGYSTTQPLGFYETYRHGAKVSQPLWRGGEVYSGYRIGRGEFEPWYKERETDEGGEFKAGVIRPLLKDSAIDGRRAAVQMARLERNRLGPNVRARVISMKRAASHVYWNWVAAGQILRTQERLLQLAMDRVENIETQVAEGDLPEIAEIDNGRFIAKRRTKLIASQRKLQEAAIKLSLFYRDDTGQPVVADNTLLPCKFPVIQPVDLAQIESDIAQALTMRPELQDLEFQRRQTAVELRYARNLRLPKLDAFAQAGQDVGGAASETRDKSELELEAGLLAEVPFQRREALGKIRAAQAKLSQITAKRRFTEDKIRSQVQDAVSALDLAVARMNEARKNLNLSRQSLNLGRARFDEGDIDLIQLNIYETSLADAELLLIEAELAYFLAAADYRAALAIDSQTF